MDQITPWNYCCLIVLCLSVLIVFGIKSCEKTYQRAFENGFSACVLPGQEGTHWCKDGEKVK